MISDTFHSLKAYASGILSVARINLPFKRLMPHEKRSLSKAYTSVSRVK